MSRGWGLGWAAVQGPADCGVCARQVQGGQKQEERETAAVLKAAEKAEKAENRAAAEEKRISRSTGALSHSALPPLVSHRPPLAATRLRDLNLC